MGQRRWEELPTAARLHAVFAWAYEDDCHKRHRAAECVNGHAASEVLEADRAGGVVSIDAKIEPAVGAPLPMRADRVDECYTS